MFSFSMLYCVFNYAAISVAPDATNIIFPVGNRMGVAYTSAYRFYQNPCVEPTNIRK